MIKSFKEGHINQQDFLEKSQKKELLITKVQAKHLIKTVNESKGIYLHESSENSQNDSI